MSAANFIVNEVSGDLTIGDKHEIDEATWRNPRPPTCAHAALHQEHALPQAISLPDISGLALYLYHALKLGSAPIVNAELRRPALCAD